MFLKEFNLHFKIINIFLEKNIIYIYIYFDNKNINHIFKKIKLYILYLNYSKMISLYGIKLFCFTVIYLQITNSKIILMAI